MTKIDTNFFSSGPCMTPYVQSFCKIWGSFKKSRDYFINKTNKQYFTCFTSLGISTLFQGAICNTEIIPFSAVWGLPSLGVFRAPELLLASVDVKSCPLNSLKWVQEFAVKLKFLIEMTTSCCKKIHKSLCVMQSKVDVNRAKELHFFIYLQPFLLSNLLMFLCLIGRLLTGNVTLLWCNQGQRSKVNELCIFWYFHAYAILGVFIGNNVW